MEEGCRESELYTEICSQRLAAQGQERNKEDPLGTYMC